MQVWHSMAKCLRKGLYGLALASLLSPMAPGDAFPRLKAESQLLFGEGIRRFKQPVSNHDANPAEKVLLDELQILEGTELSRGISAAAKKLRLKCGQRGDHASAVSCYRKSLSIATELNDPRLAAEMYLDLGATYKEMGEYGQAIECCELCLPIAAEMSDLRLETRALICIADVHFYRSDNDKALRYCQEAHRAVETLGTSPDAAKVCSRLGRVYTMMGLYQWTQDAYERSLTMSRDLKVQELEWVALNGLGILFICRGDLKKAVRFLESALKIGQDRRDRRLEIVTLGSLGCAGALDRHEEALAYYRRAVEIPQEWADPNNRIQAFTVLASAAKSKGRYAEAAGYLRRQFVLARELGDRRAIGSALSELGGLFARCDVPEEAEVCYLLALNAYREMSDRPSQMRLLSSLGDVSVLTGQYSSAMNYYTLALGMARELKELTADAQIVNSLGVVLTKLARYNEAISVFQESLEITREIGDCRTEWQTLRDLGKAYLESGYRKKAREVLIRALTIKESCEGAKQEE